MSAFLDALIARVTGGPNLVRPRPAARFEPVDPAEQGPPAITEEAIAPAGPRTTAPVEPVWRDRGSEPGAPGDAKTPEAFAPPAATAVPEPRPQIRSEAARSGQEEPGVASTGAPEPKARLSRPPRHTPGGGQSAPPGAVAAPEPATSRPPPALRPAGSETAPSTLAPASPRALSRASAAELMPAGRARSASSTAAARTGFRGDRPVVAGQPVPPPIAPPPGRAVLPAASAAESVRAGPPRIDITIGRIEVRAVSAPATAARPAPKPAPARSLDEYLARREGRGR